MSISIKKSNAAKAICALVLGIVCFGWFGSDGLRSEGAEDAQRRGDRATVLDDTSAGKATPSRPSRAGATDRIHFGKVPKSEYPIAPPVQVNPFDDEGDAFRRRTGATGPIPLPQVGGGVIAAVACSFKADCDDGNPCTDDICDIGPGAGAGTGTCKNDPIENGQSGDCDDGVFCNGLELCQGANIFHCLGTCSGGPNNGLPCATDAANADNCPNGTCNLKRCVGGPNNNAACTYDSSCTTVFGTCSTLDLPCPGPTLICNEDWDNPNDAIPPEEGGSCQTRCASDADCADPTATAATNGCTLDYCCIGGNYTRKTCVGGANVGLLCDSNTQCPSSACGNPVLVPCDVNDVCVRGNPCGPAGSCTPRFCVGGGPTFNLKPCVTSNDCGTGTGQGVCTDGTLCQAGRCCSSGNCERRPYRTCTGAVGSRKWFPGDFGRVDGSGTICPGGVNCPKYGAGVGELGAFTVVAGPTKLSPFNNLMSGAPLRKLGDDYDFGPSPEFIDLTDLRFVGGVDDIRNSRTSFEFYDQNGTFIEDIFYSTSVNTMSVQDVQFLLPLTIPSKGFIVAHVLQAFAAPNINSPGEFYWLATDAVDHGANDAANLYVDTDLNGNPVVTPNFLRACVDGVRKGAPCGSNPDCPGSTCGAVPGILAFELEGAAQFTPPIGACCDGFGACTQELTWNCAAIQRQFMGVDQACGNCSSGSLNAGAACTSASDCSFCIGGSHEGDPCSPSITQSTRSGLGCDTCSESSLNAGESCSIFYPPGCHGGVNDSQPCTTVADCPGVCEGGSIEDGQPCPPATCVFGWCSTTECLKNCSFCQGGANDGLPCPPNACPGGTCNGSCIICVGPPCYAGACLVGACEPICGTGACCDTNTGSCSVVQGPVSCPGIWQGFGTECNPHCCDQPLWNYTGADQCEGVIVHNITLPGPGDEVTLTITGNNSSASSLRHCIDGSNPGAPCSFDENCAGGTCVDDDSCFPPSLPGGELGWFESFAIDDCAYVRVDHCCTDTDPGTAVKDPKIPSYRVLYDSCPCGQTIFPKRDPNQPTEPGDGRGAPYCDEDNSWMKFGPLRAGTYYYPILSFLGGNFGKYQLHITAKTCPVAACCHNICPSVAGPACTTNADCVQPNGEVCINGICQELCDKDADCSAGQCNSTCEQLNILDCQDIGGAFLAPPNRGTAVSFCTTGACDTGSCCTGPGTCLDEFPGGDPTLTIDDCDSLNGVYVGGFKCFGGTCIGGTRHGLSCPDNSQCPGGFCDGDAQALGQLTPCPVCDIAGADHCQFFDDSVRTRNSDLTLPGGSRTADDFVPNGTTISIVCTWGEYTRADAQGNAADCSSEIQDNFSVTIYESDWSSGLPGAVKGTSTVTGANVTRVRQAPTTFEDLNQIQVFAYKLTLDSAIGGMVPGTTYWLEINNTTDNPANQNPNCLWSQMATDFVYNDYSAAGANPASGNDYGVGAGRTSDFAWCVDVSISTAPAPEHACCDCIGTCSNKTKRDCDNAGNAWHVDRYCQSFSCPVGSHPNDNCQDVLAGPSIGQGQYVFDNHCASTDGPNPIPDELGSASMANDLWFKYVVDCGGSVAHMFSTCPSGSANAGGIDTMIAVYHDPSNPTVCQCPTSATQPSLLWPEGLANDEGCTGILAGGGGFITTPEDEPTALSNPGDCFLVRVGGFAGQGSEKGTGTLVTYCYFLDNFVPIAPTKGNDDKCIGGANNGLACAQNSNCPASACQLKNRFITVELPVTATANGIKVHLISLDPNSVATPANYNGTDRWLGTPLLNVGDGVSPAFNASSIQCAFHSNNWSFVGRIHIYGDVIVPLSTYEVSSCVSSVGPCSPTLRLSTAKFGDIIAPLTLVNFQDIVSIVEKFQNKPSGPSKTRTKLVQPVNPTTNVNFQEIAADVFAFQAKTYKQIFPTPPATCP